MFQSWLMPWNIPSRGVHGVQRPVEWDIQRGGHDELEARGVWVGHAGNSSAQNA